MRAATVILTICLSLSSSSALAQSPSPEKGTQLASTVEPPAIAPSQEEPPSWGHEGIPEYTTVVTSKEPEKREFDLPLGMNVLTQARLDEIMPRSTAMALQYQPGIWVQQTGHLGGAPIIRGFMGNQVIYLFDGIRRNTVSLFSGPNSYLNNSDPLAVRRIEVIRGPGSVLYGSDAIGGVVNVITAMPLHFEEEDWRPHGRIKAWYDSVDSGLSLGGEGGVLSPYLLANVGASYQSLGDLTGGGDVGKLVPSSYRSWAIDGQAGIRLSSDDALEALAQYIDRPDGTRYDRPSRISEAQRDLYVLRYWGKHHDALDRIKIEAYYHRQQDLTDEENFDSLSLDQTVGGELQLTSKFNSFRMTYGAHYHRDWSESSDPQNGTEEPSVTWDNPALFLFTEYFVTENLTLEAGLRGDYFYFRSQAPSNSENIPLGLTEDDLNQRHSNLALTGGLGAVYRLTDSMNWVTYLGTAFRAPGRSDYLNIGEFTFGYSVPPEDTLQPERSYTAETGLRFEYKRFVGSVNVFCTLIKDLLASAPTTYQGSDYVDWDEDGNTGDAEDSDGDDMVAQDERAYTVKNVDEAQSYGLEFAGRVWIIKELSLYGNTTLMGGTQSAEEGDEPLDRGIPFNGTLGVRWEDRWSWLGYWAEFEVHGAWPFDRIPEGRASSDPAFLVDPQDKGSGTLLVDGELPGYAILNARLGVHLFDYCDITLDLENLTNHLYRVKDSRIDAPGFNARIGVLAKY